MSSSAWLLKLPDINSGRWGKLSGNLSGKQRQLLIWRLAAVSSLKGIMRYSTMTS